MSVLAQLTPSGSSVAALEEAWRRAVLEGDADALEELLDDRYVLVGPNGTVSGKADDLRANRSGAFRMARLDVRALDIEEYEDMAISSVLAFLDGSFGGARFSGSFRYLRTWARRVDVWRIVACSITAVPAPIDP